MHRTLIHRLAAAASLVAFLHVLAPSPSRSAERGFMRGMVISCPRWGPVWGSPAMAESLKELSSMGVNWVAIHPYGWLKKDGSIRFEPAEHLDFLARAVELADSAGIKMFWKPHLGYWGSFSHRGAIDFGDNPAAWARFFRDYEAFIVDQARFAESAGVRIFAVGVELEGTVRYEDVWRGIIRKVRQVYGGEIVYAANWDRLESVPFWDAVDHIGVHAYYPLSEAENPDREDLFRGWDGPLADLERLSRRTGKPVLVAEIGYNTTPEAARSPWAYESVETEAARDLRSRLIDVAISRLEHANFVTGMFWWKWMPGNGRRRNFAMRDLEAKDTLRRHWAPAPPAPPAPPRATPQ